MFSGIVEGTGTVAGVKPAARAIHLVVRAPGIARGVKRGDSVAVNGCCLTVEKIERGGRFHFSVLQETWRLTNLSQVRPGSAVNLERALRIGDRLGGHFVTGHIDGTGEIICWERSGRDWVLDIAAARDVMKYVVRKGSIALDGISLTVAAAGRKSFRVWIIPHTYEVTALRERKAGDLVNLEADLVGKYIERFVTERG